MIPFFEQYPSLNKHISLAGITDGPTPIDRMEGMEQELNYADLFLKRDDLTNKKYGGNKIRKLDFLLADAKKKGYKEVITFGYAGSNHCTATAVHSKAMGLGCTLVLLPQIPAKHLRQNLLTSHYHKAKVIYCKVQLEAYIKVSLKIVRDLFKRKKVPYQIQPGGSQALGTLGFINAIFELKAQVEAGLLPEPSNIYVPCSSLGTIVGMAIGLQLTAMNTQIQAIKVVDENYSNEKKVRKLYTTTCNYLRKLMPNFPNLAFQKAPLTLRKEFYSGTYAKSTSQSMEAIELAKKHSAIFLENTYSAHALGAMIQDIRNQKVEGPLLYWNTFNSADLSRFTKDQNYLELPEGLHYYFK